MAQIREIAGKYQDIEALGVKVVLISPQPETESRRLAEQYSLPITFLVDEDNALADSLGISVRHGVPAGMSGGYSSHTVLPTLLVTNASGTIIFSDQTDNYRVRPEPDVYLAILRRSGLVST
jgi:peroxiredoxin